MNKSFTTFPLLWVLLFELLAELVNIETARLIAPINLYESLLEGYDEDDEDKVIQGENEQYEITCPVTAFERERGNQ